MLGRERQFYSKGRARENGLGKTLNRWWLTYRRPAIAIGTLLVGSVAFMLFISFGMYEESPSQLVTDLGQDQKELDQPQLDPIVPIQPQAVPAIPRKKLDDPPAQAPAIARTVLSIDQRIYEHQEAPYFEELVVDFQARARALLDETVRRGIPTIFVSIASYRDNSCPETVKALLDQARNPQNVFIGVVDQVDLVSNDSDDVPCEQLVEPSFRSQVRLVRVPADQGRGPTHARYIASKLWDGERYFMQIDSHAGIAKHWDMLLIEMLNELPHPKTVLSHYPPTWEGDVTKVHDDSGGGVPWICKVTDQNAPDGLVIQLPETCREKNMSPIQPNRPKPVSCYSPFIGAGFFAGPAELLIAAPYDRYLPFLFHGEELLIAARLWTRGWDIYTPPRSLVSHKYGGRTKNVFVRVKTWWKFARPSEARARYLLGTSLAKEEHNFDKSELHELGVGRERSIDEYLEFAGIIDIHNKTFESRCDKRFDVETKKWVVPK